MGSNYSTNNERKNAQNTQCKTGKYPESRNSREDSSKEPQCLTTISEDSCYGTMVIPNSGHGLTAGDKRSLIKHFIYLRDTIPVDELIDRFVADGDLTALDVDGLQCQAGVYARANLFLRKLLRFKKRDAYVRLLKHLKNMGEEHIVKELLQPDDESGCGIVSRCLTKEDVEQGLRCRQDYLYNELEPDEVALNFMVERLITVDEYENIVRPCSTRRERCIDLVGLVYRKLPDSYPVFLISLQNTEQLHVVEELDHQIPQMAQPARSIRSSSSRLPTWLLKLKPKKRRSKRETVIYDTEGKPLFRYSMTVELKHASNERNVIQALRDPEVRRDINRTLVVDHRCLLEDAWHGSIILSLKLLMDPVRQSFEAVLSRILEVLLGNRGVEKYLTVNRDLITINCYTESGEDFIQTNMDFLQESVNPVQLTKSFQRRGVLSQSEVKDVLFTEPVSRRHRVKRLFDVVRSKTEAGFNDAIKVVQEELPEVYQHIRPAEECRTKKAQKPNKAFYSGNFMIIKKRQRFPLHGSSGTKVKVCATDEGHSESSFRSIDSGFFEITTHSNEHASLSKKTLDANIVFGPIDRLQDRQTDRQANIK